MKDRVLALLGLIVVIALVPSTAVGQESGEARSAPIAISAGHWPFDTDASDYTGRARNGVMQGAASITMDGAKGGALDLRGTTGYVDMPHVLLASESTCSVSYWLGNESFEPGGYSAIFATDAWNCTGGSSVHSNLVTSSESVEMEVCGSAALQVDYPADNQWVHMAFVYNSFVGRMDAYRNGSFIGTTTDMTGILCGDGSSSVFGAWDSDGAGTMARYHDGRIDDLQVFSGELLPVAISQLAGGIFADGFERGDFLAWQPRACQHMKHIIQEQDDSFAPIGGWQSFTPTFTGNLVTIEVRPVTTNGITGNLNVYEGQGTGGALLHTQAYSFPMNPASPWQNFSVPVPVPVDAGQTYTWELTGATDGIYYKNSDVYPGGTTSQPTADMVMRITVEACD